MRLQIITMAVVITLSYYVGAFAGGPSYPSTYPAAFPQFKGCKMVQIMTFPDNISAMLDCGILATNDIYEFYLNSAKKDDWEVLMENKTGGHFILMVEKGKSVMQIQVFAENNTSHLALSYVQNSTD